MTRHRISSLEKLCQGLDCNCLYFLLVVAWGIFPFSRFRLQRVYVESDSLRVIDFGLCTAFHFVAFKNAAVPSTVCLGGSLSIGTAKRFDAEYELLIRLLELLELILLFFCHLSTRVTKRPPTPRTP